MDLNLQSQTIKDVEAWLKVYESQPVLELPKVVQIRNMIESFHNFCKEYIRELSRLSHTSRQSWLEYSIDSVLFDYWEPILRAAEQNMSPHYRPMFRQGYEKLDELQKVLKSRLNIRMDEVNIVLYFEKVGKAKRFPFGSTYLIGVPLIDGYRDNWMAIPHELGHHIYWNARFSDEDNSYVPALGTNFLREEIATALSALNKPKDASAVAIRKILEDWTEEIFADIVGARIAGAEFVAGAWDRLIRKNETIDKLFESDGEHPMPYFVPYIRSYAAELEFEDHWQEYFGTIQYTALTTDPAKLARPRSRVIQIELNDLQCVLKTYVDSIRGKLKMLNIEELIQGTSAVSQLKEFVRFVRQAVIEQNADDEIEFLKSLLTPRILEKNEDWYCWRNHKNSGDRRFCGSCGAAHYIWDYLAIPRPSS